MKKQEMRHFSSVAFFSFFCHRTSIFTNSTYINCDFEGYRFSQHNDGYWRCYVPTVIFQFWTLNCYLNI